MLCPQCKAEIEKGTLYCKACGAQVLPSIPGLKPKQDPRYAEIPRPVAPTHEEAKMPKTSSMTERREVPAPASEESPMPKTSRAHAPKEEPVLAKEEPVLAKEEPVLAKEEPVPAKEEPVPTKEKPAPKVSAMAHEDEILEKLQNVAKAEKRERVHAERVKAQNEADTQPKDVPKGVWIGVGFAAVAALITLIAVIIRFNGGSFDVGLIKQGKFPITFSAKRGPVEDKYEGDTSWLHEGEEPEDSENTEETTESDSNSQQEINDEYSESAVASDFYEGAYGYDATSEIEGLFANSSEAEITQMASGRWDVAERGAWFASGKVFPESVDENVFEMTAAEFALYSGIHLQSACELDTEGYYLYHFPMTETVKKGFYIGQDSYVITDTTGKICVVDLELDTDQDALQEDFVSHDESMRDSLERTGFLVSEYKDYESMPVMSDSLWSGTVYDAYIEDGNCVLIGKSWLSGAADPCRDEFKSQLDDFDDFIKKETEDNSFPKWGINIDAEYMATLEEKIERMETLDYYDKVEYSGFTYYSLDGIPVYIIVRAGFNGWNAPREYIGSAIYYAEAPSPEGDSGCEYFFADNLYRMVDSEGNNYDYNCTGWKKYNDMGKKLIADRAAVEAAIRNDGVLPQMEQSEENVEDDARNEFRARRLNLTGDFDDGLIDGDATENSDGDSTGSAGDAATQTPTGDSGATTAGDAAQDRGTQDGASGENSGEAGYTGHTEIMQLD